MLIGLFSVYGGGFFYFLFSFFTKIYFCFQNLQEYTPAAPLPGGRDLVAPLRGGRSFSAKIFAEKPLKDRSPDSGAADPQAARQRGSCLPDTADPHLLHQKFRIFFSVCRNTIRIKDNKKM